jgi:hypothetical protein
VEAASSLAASRRAALIAAAALIGPSAPGGITDRHPDEAATAVVRVAEMWIPWLEDGTPLPEPGRLKKRREAATAHPAQDPATGVDDHGSTGTDPEEKQPAAAD